MTSANYGTNPVPIGPPSSNSHSSSDASSAASDTAAIASLAVGNANGFSNTHLNGLSNGTASGPLNGLSNGLSDSISNLISNVMMNGTSNGISNGPSNGLSNGRSSNSPPVGTQGPMAMPYGPSGDLNGANGVNGAVGDSQSTTVLVRRVYNGYSKDPLAKISAYCKQGLVRSEVIGPDVSKDPGFMGILLQYNSERDASSAIEKLNGMLNVSLNDDMTAEYLGPDQSPFGSATARSFTSPVLPHDTAISRSINGSGMLSQPGGPFANSTYQLGSHPATALSVHDAFSRAAPIGNHLTDRAVRTSSLDLINSGVGNDDLPDLTFGSLSLNDNSTLDNNVTTADASRPPFATQRRSTMPQVPTMHTFSSLRLDTTNVDHSNGIRTSGYQTPSYCQSSAPFSAHPVHSTHSAHHMGTQSAGGMNGNTSFHTQRRGPHHHQPHGRHMVPHVNPGDQHPPCNTLYVGNIPMDAKESELKALFGAQRGYKRLSLRTRNNNTMCFVEFEDVTTATKALNELYGRLLSNSGHRGGMRLSYSKNPFGVRSEHNPNNRANASASMHNIGQNTYGNNQAPGVNALGGAPALPPGLPVPANLNTAAIAPHGDGLGNMGTQIPPSAYAQQSPWGQPQQVQSVQQSYGIPGYQSYEEEDEMFTGGNSYGAVRRSGVPGTSYTYQSNGVAPAHTQNAGYNHSYGSNANGLGNIAMNGAGGGAYASMRNHSLSGANGASDHGLQFPPFN